MAHSFAIRTSRYDSQQFDLVAIATIDSETDLNKLLTQFYTNRKGVNSNAIEMLSLKSGFNIQMFGSRIKKDDVFIHKARIDDLQKSQLIDSAWLSPAEVKAKYFT